METKLMKATYPEPGNEEFLFWCPGCKSMHTFVTAWGPKRAENYRRLYGDPPVWTFNGNMESPTFSPSLLMYGDGKGYPPLPPLPQRRYFGFPKRLHAPFGGPQGSARPHAERGVDAEARLYHREPRGTGNAGAHVLERNHPRPAAARAHPPGENRSRARARPGRREHRERRRRRPAGGNHRFRGRLTVFRFGMRTFYETSSDGACVDRRRTNYKKSSENCRIRY